MENMDDAKGAGKQDRTFVFPEAANDTQKIGDEEDLGMDKDEGIADVRRRLISTLKEVSSSVVAKNSPLISSQELTEHKQHEAEEDVWATNLSKVEFGKTTRAAGEEGVIVSPPVNYLPNYTEADMKQSLLGHSQSDQAHTSTDEMRKGSSGNASNQPLPIIDTEEEKEKILCSSLLYQMKRQHTGKAGRPFKKKTLMKMVKHLAIAQGWDSEATEIPKGNHCKDTDDECQESKKYGMPEAISVSASGDTVHECNSTSDSIDSKMEDCLKDTAPPEYSNTSHPSQIVSPKPLMDLNKPCKTKPCKGNAKTTQRTKTAAMDVPVEQGLTQGTLSLSDTLGSFSETPGNAPIVQNKPRKKKAMTLKEELDLTPSNHLPALFQSNSATSQEKCRFVPTEVDMSDMKTGPVDLMYGGNMAVKSNSRKERKQIPKKISTDSCSVHHGMQLSEPGKEEAFEMAVTPHDQRQSASNKVAIDDETACTIAVGIHRKMAMKTEEPEVKSIGDVLKFKRKAGRPFKKKTLMKIAKLMAIVHEGEVEENVPKFQQDVIYFQPIQSNVKNKKKDAKNPVSNSTPPRRSSRASKCPPELSDGIMLGLTQSPNEYVLPISSGPTISILKPEDSTCTPLTASLMGIGSAEVALQNESHCFDEHKVKRRTKLLKKNTEIKKSIVTSEGSYHSKFTPDSKILPESVSTAKGLQKTTKAERKKTGIGAKNKWKQGSSASELLSSNGVSQQNIHAHTDHDKISSSIPTPTVTNLYPLLQKPCKRGIRNKKCKNEVIDAPLSNPSVSQCQSGVPNLSASPEASLLPSCVKTERDSEAPSIAEKSNSKTSRDKKRVKISNPQKSDFQPSEKKSILSHVLPAKAKTSRKRKLPSRGLVVNAKKAVILTADASLGEMPVASSPLSCDSTKYEKNSWTSDNLASKHEPRKAKGAKRKLNKADLTSNHDTENDKSEMKATMKKGIIGKTLNLNLSRTHSPSEVNSAVPDNNSILPAQNPGNSVKPKRKKSILLSPCVLPPVGKEVMAESDRPNSKPLPKVKLSKKSLKPPRQKGKTDLGNVSKNRQDTDLLFADIDNLLPDMEKGIEKEIGKKGMRKADNLNLSSIHVQSEVHSAADKVSSAPDQNPSKSIFASDSGKRQMKRKPLQKEKLSKKSVKPPTQKGKADLGNNVTEKVKKKRKLVNGNNVSKDEDLEEEYADVDNMLTENEKGIQKKSGKKGRVKKIDKDGSSTCPQSKCNSAVNKNVTNPNAGKCKLKSSVSQSVPPAAASTSEGQMAESVSHVKVKTKPQSKQRPCKTLKTVKGRPKKKRKVVKKVLEVSTSIEQENVAVVLNESVSHSGSYINDIDSTMVNFVEQKQDNTLCDSTDESNRAPSSQILNDSPDVTSLTKPPTKKAGVRKRCRRNRTGWDTRKKSKRRLNKVNSLNTVDVVAQRALDNPELSFNSSLWNSMLDETIMNIELKDQAGQLSYNQPSENTTCHNKDVLCEQKTLRKVRQQPLCKEYGAQCVTGSPKSVCDEREAICTLSTAITDLLHSNAKPRKSMQCFFCGRSFRHISAYTVHKRIHTGEKPYGCVKCGKRFSQLSKLHLHSNIHKQSEPIQCPCCSLKFPNKGQFIAHFRIHMKGTKKSSLINHKRDGGKMKPPPHVNSTVSPVPLNSSTSLRCLSCFKKFENNDTLKMHTLQTKCRSFTPHNYNVSATKCNKLSSFYVHERSHWPVKPYACSVCGKDFDQLQDLGIHSRMHSGEVPFFCAHCDQTFSSLASLCMHQTSNVCSEKTEAGRSKVDIEGFLVDQGVDRQINTPMYFKCQICKQLHRHWCQYILHLRTHTKTHPYLCETCGQQYYQAPDMCVHCQVCCKKSGEERACNASLSEVLREPPSLQNRTPEPCPAFLSDDCKEVPSPGSASVISCGSEHLEKQQARYRSCLLTNAPCGRYSCARCGKSFKQWNKLWLHQKLHRQKGSCFPCTHCNLEFRFFGSYRDHMQEHAVQSPFACPLCPKAFISEEDLNAHLCEYHKPCESLKCDTCGKGFKSFSNLEKHCVLHKGASSHYCLPCNMSFSSTCALRDHLKTHKARLDIPLPIGPVEPFLFPYHCRKCKARFTSTDLLQAHQVCHLSADSKAVNDAAHAVSTSLCSKLSKKVREDVIPASSQQKRTIPVTKRKNLYRYPHPDRLYVVPIMSSEPPVIISDTEEDPQVTIPSTHNSPDNNVSVPVHEDHINSANGSTEVIPQLPQSTPPPMVLSNDIETIQCTPRSQKDTPDMSVHEPPSVHNPPLPSTLDKDLEQNVLPQRKEISSDDDADDEGEDDDVIESSTTVVIPRDKEQGSDGFECVECRTFFTDVSELHEHYVHHARGVQ